MCFQDIEISINFPLCIPPSPLPEYYYAPTCNSENSENRKWRGPTSAPKTNGRQESWS